MSRGSSRRTWAVLGHMAELGPDERGAHVDLGRFAITSAVSRVVVIGSAAEGIHAGAVLAGSEGEQSVQVEDIDAAVALLRDEVRPGDIVLVKGSRSAGLERLADALLTDGP
jgi:UDP-N-acetylmuramoyl-tripeptide--D-alanyl-D-alanine ligase